MGAGPSVENKTFAMTGQGGNRVMFTFNVTKFITEMEEKANEPIPDDILSKARETGKEEMIREKWNSLISQTKEKIADMRANQPTPKELAGLYRKMFQEQIGNERKAFEKYWTERILTAEFLGTPNPGPLPDEDKSTHPGIFLGLYGDYNWDNMQLVFIGYKPSFIVEKYSRTVFVTPEELARLKALDTAVIPDDCNYGVVVPSDTVVNPTTQDAQGRPMPYEYTQEPTPDNDEEGGGAGGIHGPNCTCGGGHGGGGGGIASMLRRLQGNLPPGVQMMAMGPDGRMQTVGGGGGGGAEDIARRIANDIIRENPEPMDTRDNDNDSDNDNDGPMTFTYK